MATRSPISTISYNTESFLREKLDSLYKAHIIQAYMYICHKGEDGDKDHIHVRIEPNKSIDPMDISDMLKEYQFGNPLPLGCRPWRPSKEEDWILYVVHDKDYLALKYGGGEKGEKIPYEWQDIRVSDGYDMEIAFIRAKSYLEHSTVNMATRMQQGESPMSLVLQGENVYTVNALSRALQLNDYNRLAQEYSSAQNTISLLQDAIEKAGFTIGQDDTGNLILVKSDCPTVQDDSNDFMPIPDDKEIPF